MKKAKMRILFMVLAGILLLGGCGKRKCAFEGCEKEATEGEYCWLHQRSLERFGTPDYNKVYEENHKNTPTPTIKPSSGTAAKPHSSGHYSAPEVDLHDHDIESYYEDYADEYEDYDDAEDGFLEDEDAWDDY